MNRRDFLSLSAKLAAAGLIPTSLSGCGGGGGSSGDEVTPAQVSSINTSLADVASAKTTLDGSNALLAEELSLISATPSAAPNVLLAPKNSVPSVLSDYFKARQPIYSADEAEITVLHYFDPTNQGNGLVWQKQIAAHQLAYQQYTRQHTKLVAALRLFDAKNTSRTFVSPASASNVNTKSTVQIEAQARSTINATEKRLLETLDSGVNAVVKSGLTSTTLNLVASAVNAAYDYLKINGTLNNLAYLFLTYLSIDKLLASITQQSLTNLDFTNKEAVILSLAKVSIASVALLSLTKINDLNNQAAGSAGDINFITAFMASNNLVNQISLGWLTVIENLMSQTIEASLASAHTAVLTKAMPADQGDLVASLNKNSLFLTMVGLALKGLFTLFSDQSIDGTTVSEDAFTDGSTADIFSILFASPINPNDEALTAFTASSTLLNTDTIDADLIATQSNVSFLATTKDVTSEVDSDAYDFALQLADFAYLFTSQTESDAVGFATNLANLAYQFTMKIEDDAYNFAMQGMEYGYLFASRGEEVGVMADRILWMAVQIGLMADRIGEMADRIVYTEQLIVYTEILILDFGILIYGVIKQITNLILTGLAIIFDREWYSPASEDIILDTINSNVTQMLSQMHEYSLAVLENQQVLRQLTIDSLEEFAQEPVV